MEEETDFFVTNAGIVIMQTLLPGLFSRANLLKEGAFVSEEAKRKGVHIVQFLATGQTGTEERDLTLNKLLCGLQISDPVAEDVQLTPNEKEFCLGALKATISHWTAIGNNSTDEFRSNWLIRDGNLTAAAAGYELEVEKRAYDIVLSRSPYSFSTIKFDWMEKPIYVSWSY
jgi:hypothetical protein